MYKGCGRRLAARPHWLQLFHNKRGGGGKGSVGFDDSSVNYSVVLSHSQLISGPPIRTILTDAFLPSGLMPHMLWFISLWWIGVSFLPDCAWGKRYRGVKAAALKRYDRYVMYKDQENRQMKLQHYISSLVRFYFFFKWQLKMFFFSIYSCRITGTMDMPRHKKLWLHQWFHCIRF